MYVSQYITQIDSYEAYLEALVELESLMEAEFGTAKGERLDALVKEVQAYEYKHINFQGD